jgi:hypothetical protein
MGEAAITLKVHLQPRATHDGVVGVHGDAIKIKVSAPSLEGKANNALTRFIAKKLGISSSQVDIIAGHRSREKLLRIAGISRGEIEKALGISLQPP